MAQFNIDLDNFTLQSPLTAANNPILDRGNVYFKNYDNFLLWYSQSGVIRALFDIPAGNNEYLFKCSIFRGVYLKFFRINLDPADDIGVFVSQAQIIDITLGTFTELGVQLDGTILPPPGPGIDVDMTTDPIQISADGIYIRIVPATYTGALKMGLIFSQQLGYETYGSFT